MAYVRWSDNSSIYMYPSAYGGIICCGCLFSYDDEVFSRSGDLRTYEEAIEHVRKHIAAGHKVPDYVIPALEEDMREGRSLEPVEELKEEQ